MIAKVINSFSNRKLADALILPFFEGQKPAFSELSLKPLFQEPLKTNDFQGKSEEALCHYPAHGKEKRLLLVGLGPEKEITTEQIRLSYGRAIQALKGKATQVNILFPHGILDKEEAEMGAYEGIFLGNYVFDANKTQKEKTVTELNFIGGNAKLLKKAEIICKGVHFARDLVMKNADEKTPTFLGEKAKELAEQFTKIKATVFNRDQIVKQKMGLLEAVSRGSHEEPRFIILEYKGAPHSKELTALVGKGVTFDTGGLNLKATGSMETMRDDMAGAAAVLATFQIAASLKLPINLIGAIAATENIIGPLSYKPGDVFRSYSGIMVEVSNTDAEGRLILADAVSYVQKKYKPSRIIDIATLTGGAVIALGEDVSPLLSNNNELADALFAAGEKTFERLWRLPLYPEYRTYLKSKVADIKNSGPRKASSILGATFIHRFIGDVKWAHIDIAATAFLDQGKTYQPVQATGVGVRLFIHFLENLIK